jgi:hypothetical protein
MAETAVHRELRLPNPTISLDQPPAPRPPFGLAFGHLSWLEIHRLPDGKVRHYLGAPTAWELDLTFNALQDVFPGAQLQSRAVCPIGQPYRTAGFLLRAVPNASHHYYPMQLAAGVDRAGVLLRSFSARSLEGQEIVLQILFQRVPMWERSVLSHGPSHYADGQEPRFRALLAARQAEPPYHVEIRAGLLGSNPRFAYDAIRPWLWSWLSTSGGQWWSFRDIKPKRQEEFFAAFSHHEIDRFAAKKVRRDISGSELSQLLPIPWMERHPEVSYAGAPAGRVPRELVSVPGHPPYLVVGHNGDDWVRLPPVWNHLAILGRTRSGKSTLALRIVLDILRHQPEARVVVLEPTGNMVRDLKARLGGRIADDTIEIDPAHPTFVQDGAEMATVPLNLLHLPHRGAIGLAEFERKAERLSGDLLQAVKNAWGEQSVGGRADFILRAVLQGLLSVEGTNLVDAYSVLSDKGLLQRLEHLSSGDLLKNALRVHLPRLDYSMTISSLDKVGKIATNPLLRKALCQRYGPVSFDHLLQHELLLLNLGKDALGTEASDFLGAIFLTQLWSALQERSRKDVPVYLVVDEFHNFAIPSFADMLSEGARLGLHVVAITQYLNRIPEKVRSAMMGNVDAWAFFPVGAEDVKDVYAIAQGAQYGWRPEHFVEGLGPHEVALATRGSLLKVGTYPLPGPVETKEDLPKAIERSVRRYAQREDSTASPLTVSSEEVRAFLGAFSEVGGMTRSQLAAKLGRTPPEVDAAIAFCKATGDVIEEEAGEVRLEARGLFHRQAMSAARNEGEEHTGLLADVAALLQEMGIQVRIVDQQGGYLLPDAEFDWGGRTYSVEIECSTLVKAEDQVVRNVRKALSDDRRCLLAVTGAEAAARAAMIVRGGLPRAKLWRDFGVVWVNGQGELTPFTDGRRPPWPFLPGGREVGPDEEGEEEAPEPEEEGGEPEYDPQFVATNESDLALTRKIAQELLASGTDLATVGDFLERVPPDGGNPMDAHRLGMALGSLGITCRRVRRGGEKIREYDLRPLSHGPDKSRERREDLTASRSRSDSDDKRDGFGFAS